MLKRLNMLPKMQESHFVKKYSVQFVNASGKLSAPFYFWDNKPHECSQTWQVVRSEFDKLMLDNAREHGVDVARGRARARRAVRGRPRRRRARQGRGRRRARGAREGGGGRERPGRPDQNRLRLRVWDPVLNKGAIWTYWEGAYRDTGQGRGRDDRHPDPEQERLVLVHPAPRQHRQRRRRRAVRLPVQGPRPVRSRPTRRRSRPARRSRSASSKREARHRLLRDQGLLLSRDQVAGDGWVLVGDAFGFLDPLYSSGVLLALQSGELAADAICEGLAKGDTSKAQLGKWGPAFNEGVDRMRRLVCEYYDGFSFGKFVKSFPHLQGKVTDLLIGDLFTDKVDVVWPPMESLYEAGKQPIPKWNAGTPVDQAVDKHNELMLPEGRRP